MRRTHAGAARVVALAAVGALALAGCGSSSSKPATLALKVSENGKQAQFTVPATTKGGLVRVELANQGKAPHSAQLVLIRGNHTVAEVVKQIAGNNNKTPEWVRAEGGVGTVPPGGRDSATVNLPAGSYGVIDLGGQNGPGGSASFKVTAGKTGSLPATKATVTGARLGKDKFAWQVSGLKAGANQLEFRSQGKESIHLLIAARLKGNPSLAAVKKALQSSGPPPAFLDQRTMAETAALDGGKSTVTMLKLPQGQYVLFCPLTDRDGGKPHFLEGMLKKVTIG